MAPCPHCHLPYVLLVSPERDYPIACCIRCGHPFTTTPEGHSISLPGRARPLVVGLDAWLEGGPTDSSAGSKGEAPPEEAPPF